MSAAGFQNANRWNTFLSTLRQQEARLLRRRRSGDFTPSVQSLESRVLLSLDPIGPQFNVAESFGVEANAAVVDAYGDGDFVMAWESYEDLGAVLPAGDGSGYGVYAGRFDQDGNLVGSVVQVNTFATGDQLNPAISADANGNFVVVWQSRNVGDATAEGWDIYYQLFDSSGNAIGTELRANENVVGDQVNAGVAMDADGDFVIVWQGTDAEGTGILARGFDESGNPLTSEFLVNMLTDGDQLNPAIDVQNATDGAFVITWDGPGEPVDPEHEEEEEGRGIWANVFENGLDDTPATLTAVLAQEFLVNATSEHDQVLSDVAVDASGDFVVVWQTEGVQASGSDIFGRRFDYNPVAGTVTAVSTDGTTGDFQANTIIERGQSFAAVDMDDAGNFFVTWQSSHQDGFSFGIFGQAYDASGSTVGTETQVNTETSGPQTRSDVGIAPGGETIVTWLGREPVTHGFGVHAQRFTSSGLSPLGAELFLVSSIAIEDDAPGIASDANGNFVVVWQSYDEDGSGLGVFARLYAANGLPLSGAFPVNTTTIGNQSHPRVARAADGRFVVVWQTDTTTGDGHEIIAQLFDAVGNKVGGEIVVNSNHAGDQAWPAVAMDAAGNFIVVWEGAGLGDTDGTRDIYYQRFDAAGTPIGTEQRVNTITVTEQFMPSVAMNAAGEFVIAWVSDHPSVDPETADGDSEKSIFIQKFDAAGNVLGDPEETLATIFVEEAQEYPAIGIDAQGNFVIVWQAINHPAETGSGRSWGVFVRRFDRLKNPLSGEVLVNETTEGTQRYAAIAMDAAGNFVISWQSQHQDASSWGIFAREFRWDMTPLTGEYIVNTFEDGPQVLPAVAWSPAGNVVIVWEGRGSDPEPEPHGSGAIEGVHARLYEKRLLWRTDFNGDGFEDVAEMKANGEWWVGLSNGSDAFTSQLWADWADAINFAHIDFGDFNGDGLTDIVGLDLWGNWWVGLSSLADAMNPSNRFVTGLSWADWPAASNFFHVAVGDFDGNGYADVAGLRNDGRWIVGLSDTVSQFVTATTPWATWAGEAAWSNIEVGDFNSDGATDIVGLDVWGNWWVGLNNGLAGLGSPDAGSFSHTRWAHWAGESSWGDLEVGDFNGDGAADIAGFDIWGNWWIGLNNGAGFTTGLVPTADWESLFAWGKIGLGDFNDDGFTDLAGFDRWGGWWIGLNNTSGGFVTNRWATWDGLANWAQLDLLDVSGSDDVPPDESGASDSVGFDTQGRWRVGLSNETDALVGDAFWAEWDPAETWATLNDALTLQRQLDRLALV